jgi:hypothetical protein
MEGGNPRQLALGNTMIEERNCNIITTTQQHLTMNRADHTMTNRQTGEPILQTTTVNQYLARYLVRGCCQ